MVEAEAADSRVHGVTLQSAAVYQTMPSSYPIRVEVWNNTDRPNTNPADFGPGSYIDPRGEATDDAVTVLISPDDTVINASRANTDTACGDAYVERPIADGDTLILVYPDGRRETRVVRMTNLGYGYVDLSTPGSLVAELDAAYAALVHDTTYAEATVTTLAWARERATNGEMLATAVGDFARHVDSAKFRLADAARRFADAYAAAFAEGVA
jgi:hypothetical protein